MTQNAETLISRLNQPITLAREDEARSQAMENHISDHLASLHSAVSIRSKNPEQALMRFVVDYVESAPQHLQALYMLSSEAGIDDYTEPFLNLACTYMLTPPRYTVVAPRLTQYVVPSLSSPSIDGGNQRPDYELEWRSTGTHGYEHGQYY